MSEPIKALATGKLFDGKADCYVLEGERRVISERGIVRALGAKHGHLGRYLTGLPSGFMDMSFGAELEILLPESGIRAKARDAQFLADLCDAYVDAFMAGALRADQEHLARAARAVQKAFERVGIVAAVDEATNYQAVRASDDLRRLYDRLLRQQTADWSIRWKPSVIEALCRLYRHPYKGGRIPRWLTRPMAMVYETIFGDQIVGELRRRNPEPRYLSNHHQWLQDEVQRLLDDDLRTVELLATQSATPKEFWHRMRAHYRKEPLQLGLVN
jgi:hypothetical protein